MGPHHHKGGEHTAVGPATFRANEAWPNREPGEVNWYDARLGGNAKVWRDDYYMIPFGLCNRRCWSSDERNGHKQLLETSIRAVSVVGCAKLAKKRPALGKG